jgi:hypothetical protein
MVSTDKKPSLDYFFGGDRVYLVAIQRLRKCKPHRSIFMYNLISCCACTLRCSMEHGKTLDTRLVVLHHAIKLPNSLKRSTGWRMANRVVVHQRRLNSSMAHRIYPNRPISQQSTLTPLQIPPSKTHQFCFLGVLPHFSNHLHG